MIRKSFFIPLLLLILVFSVVVQAKELVIEYGYAGKYGVIGIADTAVAKVDGVTIAKAESLNIIEKEPGPNLLKVRETHYSQGKVIYEGYIEFRFTGMGAEKVRESAIRGTKRYDIFRSWPDGAPGGFGGGYGGFGGGFGGYGR